MVQIGRAEESRQVYEADLTFGFPSLQCWRVYHLSDILRDDRRG